MYYSLNQVNNYNTALVNGETNDVNAIVMTQPNNNLLQFNIDKNEDSYIKVYAADQSLFCDLGQPATTECTMDFKIYGETVNQTFIDVQDLTINWKSECWNLATDYTDLGYTGAVREAMW